LSPRSRSGAPGWVRGRVRVRVRVRVRARVRVRSSKEAKRAPG